MSRIEKILAQIDQQERPPVHLWKPTTEGEIDIRIDVNGAWFHEGSPILRDRLVRLFASILWFEDQNYYLVTPVEKLKIQVEDVPFVIHQAEFADPAWLVISNVHEQVIIGQNNPVELRKYGSQWVPYVRIRYDLWARVNRSIYVQWVNQAIEADQHSEPQLALKSDDYLFYVARL